MEVVSKRRVGLKSRSPVNRERIMRGEFDPDHVSHLL